MNKIIRIGGVPEHFNLPWQLAMEMGLFEKEGIDLQWEFYPAGTGAMVKALKEGNLDMAVLLTEGAISAIINGLEAKLVQQYVSSPLIWGIHSGPDSGINNIGGCENRKYAISRFGSGSHLMAMIDAEVRGKKINQEDFVLIENMAGALKSLTENASQAFFWEKYTTKPLVDSGQLRRIGDFVTPWSCFQIAASNKALAEQNNAVIKICEIIGFTASQFMKAPNAIDILIEKFGMNEEDAHNWFYSTEWQTDNQISSKMIENVMFSLKKIGAIGEPIAPNFLVAKQVLLT
ncbi:MAG: ABC transporter substrate-binding protein [Bacteroidia bacterium]|nr:ABC transporter substrate-binding protein [Bacteroidia bacterium]